MARLVTTPVWATRGRAHSELSSSACKGPESGKASPQTSGGSPKLGGLAPPFSFPLPSKIKLINLQQGVRGLANLMKEVWLEASPFEKRLAEQREKPALG